ncbi:hypothetical protein FHW58_004675 [Duganella sp. 1224]|uniref:hypothetical protein n=1 Tax=Duganella sp. 1224 TaxID=2587052 RepID=UPI0015CD845F|nr:hypothetical protein [Duganella sp. 1224]NYE63445.1 hypothetical protein [Duganella sp. 1224]
MKTFTKAFAIALFSLPLMAQAAGKSASAAMQVSFEVKEACTVQTSAGTAAAANQTRQAAPSVACQLKTPYLMTRTPSRLTGVTSTTAQTGAIQQETGSGEWTITF